MTQKQQQKLINSLIVKPIPIDNKDAQKPPHHWMLFNEVAPNVFIISKKRSGKTTVIFHILKKAMQPGETIVIIFCSTAERDKSYKTIKDYIEKHGNKLYVFLSMYDEQKNNILGQIMKELEENNEEENDEDEEEVKAEILNERPPIQKQPGFTFRDFLIPKEPKKEEKKEEKKKESKYSWPKYIFIFDDLSGELRNSFVDRLLKTNRHYNAMTIVSSQYANDIMPSSLKQADNILLFKSFDQAKLDKIYTLADLNLGDKGKEKFFELYKHATDKKFSFLYIDTRENKYRRNFLEVYDLVKFFKKFLFLNSNI